MSRAEADESSTWAVACERLVSESRSWLGQRGALIVGSGCFLSGELSGSVHCDYGPPGQDKRVNQDFALAWLPPPQDRRGPRLVVAIGDGLTNSYLSEYAAALACWLAARTLVESAGSASPIERAKNAFNTAGRALGLVAEKLAREPENSCPEGQFLSTWKYILKKGSLFQTTLTLAWLDADCFRVAVVGDGGALWRRYEGSRFGGQTSDRILAACSLDSQQVHALGPNDREVGEFDCWCEERIAGPFTCALSTDGVGRGTGNSPLVLLEELDRAYLEYDLNEAKWFIEGAIRERPKDFDDNLTLAVIRMQ